MSAFNGTWKFVESSNLRELFDEIGAFKELADAADQFKPIVILTVNDTELHMKITMFDREVERVYELGKEVDEVSLDGRNVRVSSRNSFEAFGLINSLLFNRTYEFFTVIYS
ncbi:unnamed protein product [Trichobilharzia regenti]|nr:unnamed protein product [Trichobilharzia regenti]